MVAAAPSTAPTARTGTLRAMWARLSIVAGLVVGVAVAGLVLGGMVAFAPDPPPPSTPAPSAPVASPSAIGRRVGRAPSQRPVAAPAAAAFHVGEPAPALSYPRWVAARSTSPVSGKPVWINFMATWCPPCQDEFPLMNGFAARYAANGLVVIAVDVREDEGAVAAFADQLDATFPLGLDADGGGRRRGTPSPCRSISGSTRRASCATGRSAASARRHGDRLETILPGVDVTP